MSRQNLKHRCVALFSAFFASTFVTNNADMVGNNNVQSIKNTDADASVNSDSLSTPLKFALGISSVIGLPLAAKFGYDYYQYRNALSKAKKAVSSIQKDNQILDSWINRLENSGLSWKLKAILLNFMNEPVCRILVPFLQNQCERQEISRIDQQTQFGFLKDEKFITACKEYRKKNGMSREPLIDACLQFIGGYLKYNEKSLLSNPPESYDNIPNWKLIKKIINGIIEPVEKPIKEKNSLILEFVIKTGNRKNESVIFTLEKELKKKN